MGLHRDSVVQKYDIVEYLFRKQTRAKTNAYTPLALAWRGITGPFAKAERGIKSILPRGCKRRRAPTLNQLFLPGLSSVERGRVGCSRHRKRVRSIILSAFPLVIEGAMASWLRLHVDDPSDRV